LTSHDIEYRVEFTPTLRSDEQITSARLPFYYPKVAGIAYVYQVNGKKVLLEIKPLLEDPGILTQGSTPWILKHLMKMTLKFCRGHRDGYQKRVHHDLLIPKITFQDTYARLKEKYGFWVKEWTEETDPSKHVFEDISIAAFLICLWEKENIEMQQTRKQRFVDVGCGNGFLVYVLASEGYEGFGADISKRKLWDKLSPVADLRGNRLFFKMI
jgi:tRNASer (uridine44-2'-O)-methyltransferase